jgi:hypothetical protein
MRKEIPILFSTEMVQAILQGRKTITRRTSGLDKVNEDPDGVEFFGLHVFPDGSLRAVFKYRDSIELQSVKCPYGKPGDLLWVRETVTRKKYGAYWGSYFVTDPEYNCTYEASGYPGVYFTWPWEERAKLKDGKKVPSIFMRKWEARIWLEVTDIRVERLQDISQEDARDEGIINKAPHRCPGWKNELLSFSDCYKCPFRVLWNKINGERGLGWDKNPWVWVISFQVLSTTGRWAMEANLEAIETQKAEGVKAL